MGKHAHFLSKTLKTIPYPKKGSSDRRLKDAEQRIEQLEEELALQRRQGSLDGKRLAEAWAESARWRQKYDHLHAMVGRHTCDPQRPPQQYRRSYPPASAFINGSGPRPELHRRSTTKTLSTGRTLLPLSPHPEEDDQHDLPAAASSVQRAATVATRRLPPAGRCLSPPSGLALALPDRPALIRQASAPRQLQAKDGEEGEDETEGEQTTASNSATTTLVPPSPCTSSSSSLSSSSSPSSLKQASQPPSPPSPPSPPQPSGPPPQTAKPSLAGAAQLASIPLLFALSSSTRFLQRGPVYPTAFSAERAAMPPPLPVHAPGSLVQLLGLNVVLVVVGGELVARWWLWRRQRQQQQQPKKKGAVVGRDEGEGEGEGQGCHMSKSTATPAAQTPVPALVAAVCGEAGRVALVALLAFVLVLFEIRDVAQVV